MSKNEAVAIIMTRVAMLNAEVAGMQAENQQRAALGHSMAYCDHAFVEAARASGCTEDDVRSLLDSAGD